MLLASISNGAVLTGMLQILGSLDQPRLDDSQPLAGSTVQRQREADAIENRVDMLCKPNNKSAAQRIQGGAVVETEMMFIDLNNHLEAVANHALNIVQVNRREMQNS